MSDRLKVAMVAACPFPWPRGTPIRIHRMAEAVARRGHEVHVATYHLGEALTDAPFLLHRIRDVPSYRYTAPGPTARKLVQLDPMLAGLLRRLHRDVGFDVVHAHHYEGLLVASRSAAGTPIVYDAHTTLAGELPDYRLGLPRWLARGIGAWLDRRLPARADHTVAVISYIRDALVSNGATTPERIHVVANGVEWERFDVAHPGDRDGRTVIFTGNLSPYQRVDLLIEAFAQLHARRPDTRLMITTDSSFAPFEARAQELGVRDAIDLRNAPFPQQPALLAGAAVTVNPRVACDGIPQKLLNYMAAAAPIVSFEGSAGHLQHEITGLRVPNGDTTAMARAIERLLDDPALARRLGAAARDLVQRAFSWDGVAERVEQIYFDVLSRAAGRPTVPRSASP